MRSLIIALALASFVFTCKGPTSNEQEQTQVQIPGLEEAVEVIRDEYGINHIYAKNQRDLFFAQGYCAAKDRLFQFEIWRRQATGTVAEILGKKELQRDIGTRLFKFRGDMQEEMAYYHPDGIEIITAYTDGVNAYIQEALKKPDELPATFKALNILPQKWTPEVVISRHQGLLGNINLELAIGQAVAKLGVEKVKEYYWFHPQDPKLELDSSIDGSLLTDDILALYRAYRQGINFQKEDITPAYRGEENQDLGLSTIANDLADDNWWIGSNNWVTRPDLAANGHAYMANDPHRRISVPSLRYWVHLSAPGWNVIGGGEPEIPGVSIGHNDHGAWGLTVFRTDGEDLYVYDLNPDNPFQYQYQGDWRDMEVIQESIPLGDEGSHVADLRYTHHGPVTYIDSVHHKAYAVRCAWMEPGGAPYLASLRMDQAKNWEEFRAACNYSHIPGENMIWADQEGNIGWQAVGIAPIRPNFSGMVPVPGDGRYEWDGYLPIIEKPHVYNPAEGFFATANQNVTPADYDRWDAIGFNWSDPYRGQRVDEVLSSGKKLTMEDMQRLQTDYLSIPAGILVPMLANLTIEEEIVQQAKATLKDWDFVLNHQSAAAAIYVAWENELRGNHFDYYPDPAAEEIISNIQMAKIIQWIQDPASKMGENSPAKRDQYLVQSFTKAVQDLAQQFGDDISTWTYGHPNFKHVQIMHPLGAVVNSDFQEKLNTKVLPRGGNQYTPGATGSSKNQRHGATFRIIVDVNDWDQSVGMNAPGQSGDPESKFYGNLFESWAKDEFFPVCFSREKVEANAAEKYLLNPEE